MISQVTWRQAIPQTIDGDCYTQCIIQQPFVFGDK